ncbi:MAG: GH3 auxin-responsive promoter family protein [Candidatus Omnitrophica bacterium]|nr:GH3 auxin-responsive promoter family protein [Candidatus Omnitrophota bacterium]
MNIVSYALKILVPKAKAFEEATKDPIKAQRKALFEFLVRNQKTKYGLKYNFSKIKSIDEYQDIVPLNNYEMLYPYIERMTRGESNILTVDKPILFGITSGTTGRPKFIPVTKYSRSKKADVMDLWIYYISRDHPEMFDGKILALVSPEVEGHTESGMPYGAETGHGYKNLPDIVKALYVLPYQVFEIKDYNARYYTILRIGLEHNVTTIATMNPSTIILLCRKIEKIKQNIIKDIEKGILDKDLDIPGDIRKTIEKSLKPNPKRANELKMILKERKGLLPKYFWPNMALIECWKGGTVGLYLREFPRYFGNVPVRDFGYLSSEARSSIPISDEGSGGILAVNANFYEFIPKEDIGKSEKRILLCDQLEKGREYSIVLTTPGGLYRYNIDDVIRVDGFFNKTPIIKFVQKGLDVTSITGEKLYESQVVEAVNRATERHKLFIEFFAALIQWGKIPRYVFLVEFTENPPMDKKKDLLRSIEQELCHINVEYQTKRKSQRLDHPVLKVVSNGDFEKYRARKVQEGMHDGQFKIPQLTPDLGFQKNFNIEEEISID